jgi:predicted dehydrogenase
MAREVSQPLEIGVGVIGYAFMGKAHTNALKTLPYMIYPTPALPRLAAIAGRDLQELQAARERYGYQACYTDWRDLVADPAVQLVDNGGPNDIHAEASIAAAEAHKAVLCEKPLARNAAEAKTMLEAVNRTGVVNMVAFNYRFVPALRYAHDLIAAGTLGTIYHFRARYLQDWLSDPSARHSWRLTKERAGSGALGDLGSHIVDLARFLVGEPTAVSATTHTFTTSRPGGTVDVDDAFAAAVEFASGAIGTLEASRVATGHKNGLEIEVNGTTGSLRFNLERLNELQVCSGSDGFTDVLITNRGHPFMGYWWGDGHVIGWEHTFVHEFAHLFDAIANGGAIAPYGATFEDGYRAAVVCDAIADSARAKTQVRITY